MPTQVIEGGLYFYVISGIYSQPLRILIGSCCIINAVLVKHDFILHCRRIPKVSSRLLADNTHHTRVNPGATHFTPQFIYILPGHQLLLLWGGCVLRCLDQARILKLLSDASQGILSLEPWGDLFRGDFVRYFYR